MLQSKVLVAGCALSLFASACSGAIAGGDGDGAEDGDGESPGDEDFTGPGVDDGLPPLPPGAPCRVAVPMRRLTERQYRNAIRDIFAGKVLVAGDFALPTIGAPESGFTTDPNFNAVDLGAARSLHEASIAVPLAVVDKLPSLLPCAGSPSEDCALQFIDRFGRLAYRRPLLDEEKTTLRKAFALGQGSDAFKDGIAAVVATLLQSPQFLYQVEAGVQADEAGVRKLDGYELATRLSLLLWDSIPDEALLDAAAAGELDDAEGVRTQVERMLADGKAAATVVRFAREWIHLEVPKPGERLDKTYTQTLADAMQSEFDGFVSKTFLSPDASLQELFTSDAAFENATLNSFYEAQGGLGPRAGLLTQPAFLTGVANPAATSPIRRSVFVRRRLTCESFPEPPNDAQAVESDFTLPPDAGQRERSAARNMDTRCAGCHTLIDPLGFGFESFDELGRHLPEADSRGDFVSPVSDELAGPFDTVAELGERLAGSPAVHECLARQWFRFGYGRLEGEADACAVQGLARHLGDSGLLPRELLVGLATAEEFRFRRVE